MCAPKSLVAFLVRCLVVFIVGGVISPVAAASLDDDSLPPRAETTPSGDDLVKRGEQADISGDLAEKPELNLGGALRLNAFVKSWDEANKDRGGDFAFDTLRFNIDGSAKSIDFSAEYRFYSGYHMLHHGYVGHTFGGGSEVQVGVHRVPFGLLPYASHNWFFDLTYYLGFEDDYDAGVKVILPLSPFDLQLAFYKNDEGSFTGDSIDSARYSYDIVHSDENELGYAGLTGSRTDEEINQFNGRLAYTMPHGDSTTEIGISAEYGSLYNTNLSDTGSHSAYAVHLNGNYGRFNIMIEGLRFSNDPVLAPDQDERFVVMGAYDAPYKVAAKGSMFVLNVAYKMPVDWKLADSLTFYNDFSYLSKREQSFSNSQQNVLGMLITSGKLYTYVDAAFGKNHPWIGSDYGSALAEGAPEAEWELRFNINIGYCF